MSSIDSKFKEELKIEHSLLPNINDIEFLTRKLNDETAELGSTHPFAFFIRNKANEIVAGCNGFVVFGAIYTDQLLVHPEWRKKARTGVDETCTRLWSQSRLQDSYGCYYELSESRIL